MLIEIIEGDSDFVDSLSLSFSIPILSKENMHVYTPLIEDGEDVIVSVENRKEYVALWAYAVLKYKFVNSED
jgi:hypothetical protein